MDEITSQQLLTNIRQLIEQAQQRAVRSVNFERVLLYWNMGKHIVEEEQRGKQRADYGKAIIQSLADALTIEYGSGYSFRQLNFCRQFYQQFPNMNALRSQLNWTQYRILLRIDDEDKRSYYIEESCNNNWSARQLERQINSQLYERLLLSSDKGSVLAVAKKEAKAEKPQDIIKDPMVLEFLGLSPQAAYYEKDLEQALITNMQAFLLELGNGFSFVSRQQRIHLEDDDFFIDLVFYNRLLRCFVIVEIKTEKLTHQHLGQLQMYVNYYDRMEKQPDENPTIGILLCADKNNAVVEFALPEENKTILASQYQLYLPKEDEILSQIAKTQDPLN